MAERAGAAVQDGLDAQDVEQQQEWYHGLMLARAQNLLSEALQLPEKARADVAGRLILSLHPQADPDVEAAWAEEIDRRLDSFEKRKASSRPWSSIKQSILRTQRARARRKTPARG